MILPIKMIYGFDYLTKLGYRNFSVHKPLNIIQINFREVEFILAIT